MATRHISENLPDHELVTVSEAFVAAENDYLRVNRERGHTMTEAEQLDLDAAHDAEQAARVTRMSEFRATSIQGFKARAAALLAVEPADALEEEVRDGDDGSRLRLLLVRDLAAS